MHRAWSKASLWLVPIGCVIAGGCKSSSSTTSTGSGGMSSGTGGNMTSTGLVVCSCDALHPKNEMNPACGCPGSSMMLGSGPSLSSMGSAQFTSGLMDGSKNRLVLGVGSIGDATTASRGALWAVDLKTGARSVLTGVQFSAASGTSPVGSGDPMLEPTDIRAGTDGWYVMENTSTATLTKQLQRIDPSTGARKTLITTDQFTGTAGGGHPISCSTTFMMDTSYATPGRGLGIGPNNEVYVSANNGGYTAILKIVLGTTPKCTVVSGANYNDPMTDAVGSGPTAAGYDSIDFVNGSLYSFDFVQQALFKIDPASGARTVVSSPDLSKTVGMDADSMNVCWTDAAGGPNVFGFASGVAWSGGPSMNGIALTRVDLSNGNRSCIGGSPKGTPIPLSTQPVDSTVGVWAGPMAPLVYTAGPKAVWVVDTTAQVANVLSE